MGNPTLLLIAIMVLVMVVGTAMDMTPTILILTPVLMPVIKAAGIDPVYFGVLFIINNSIGLITPPVGTVLNVVAGVGRMKMDEVTRGVLPFMLARVRRDVPDGAVPVAGAGAGALAGAVAASCPGPRRPCAGAATLRCRRCQQAEPRLAPPAGDRAQREIADDEAGLRQRHRHRNEVRVVAEPTSSTLQRSMRDAMCPMSFRAQATD